jgi:hypothetical protein
MTISLKSLRGGSGSNGFSLLVGSSVNTTFTFDTDQPAGAYSVSSELSDTTFDIYLVTSGNESAGYTNSGALDATAAFNRIVLYGGTENDILHFEFRTYTSPATKGDVADGAAPFLTSATPTTLDTIDDTTTVTGGNFAADVSISFIGQDTVVVPAKSVVRSSSTELIVTRPDAFPVAQEPFSMTATNAGITNPSVVVNKLTDYFDAGSGLVWVTTSPLPGFITDSAYSETLEATDVDGGAITYAVTTGSLPTGLSLGSATGVISGTPTGTAEETFTVSATDAGGNSSPREFLLPKLPLEVDYLVIAGGGGGGSDDNNKGGGGGGGGYRSSVSGESSGGGGSAESDLSLSVLTNYTVTIGAGGSGSAGGEKQDGGSGSNSVFSTVSSTGGGGGGSQDKVGRAGGSGGGGGGGGAAGGSDGGSGTSNQGFAGGDNNGLSIYSGAGGGGAGEVGGNGGSVDNSLGGDGVSSSISGSSVDRAGGGAGSSISGNKAGGDGGGGDFTLSTNTGSAGQSNTGGGGGGSRSAVAGGTGGSGVVILKYPDSYTLTIGGGLTSSTATAGGYKVTTFTAGTGTVSFA